MRKLAFLIVVILTLLLMFTQSEASETVRLVACNFPPYEFEHPLALERALDAWVIAYNTDYPHSALGYVTPCEYEWMIRAA